MMNNLLEEINNRNAKTLAWIAESPETRWATTLTTDLAHWAESGVTTPAELEKYLLVCDVYEAHRAAWGFKPSWSNLMSWDITQLNEELNECCAEIRRQNEAEEQAKMAEEQAKMAEEQAEKAAYAAALNHRTGWAIGQLVAL